MSTNGGSFVIALRGVGAPAQLVASPTAFDFGPVAVGTTVSRTVTVRNVGLTPLTGWTGGGVAAPFGGGQNCVVAGGLLQNQTCSFIYSFTPSSAGAFTATTSVTTNGGSFSITLKGRGDAGLVVANPLGIDFGPVKVGGTATRSVTIRNAGIGPVTGWTGGGLVAPFGAGQNCNVAGGLEIGRAHV